ncbi:hypothetical protein SFR_3277 [Streptomyces sp. FR-008]|nr:hypothetical protein SFR_3277 [Streptomyces sp. FR-008]
MGAPQLLEGAETQQGAHGALSGICDQGVVGGRVHDRWLLGSRHPASLARSFVTRSARPNIRPSGLVQNRPTPTNGVTLALHATRAHLRTPGDRCPPVRPHFTASPVSPVAASHGPQPLPHAP